MVVLKPLRLAPQIEGLGRMGSWVTWHLNPLPTPRASHHPNENLPHPAPRQQRR
jgi:hypothetical protein